jgi:hypothetical protein
MQKTARGCGNKLTLFQEAEADDGAGQSKTRMGMESPERTSIPHIPSFHLSLRVPKGSEILLVDGTNTVMEIHRDWERIQQISDSLRRGQLPGVTGKPIRDIFIVGRGVPIMVLHFFICPWARMKRQQLDNRLA